MPPWPRIRRSSPASAAAALLRPGRSPGRRSRRRSARRLDRAADRQRRAQRARANSPRITRPARRLRLGARRRRSRRSRARFRRRRWQAAGATRGSIFRPLAISSRPRRIYSHICARWTRQAPRRLPSRRSRGMGLARRSTIGCAGPRRRETAERAAKRSRSSCGAAPIAGRRARAVAGLRNACSGAQGRRREWRPIVWTDGRGAELGRIPTGQGDRRFALAGRARRRCSDSTIRPCSAGSGRWRSRSARRCSSARGPATIRPRPARRWSRSPTGWPNSIVEFERRVAGRDAKPTGRLRVTTVEAVGQRFMPSILAQFQAQNPGVVIDLDPVGPGAEPVAARRRRGDPGDQRPAGDAGRPAHLHGALGRLPPPRSAGGAGSAPEFGAVHRLCRRFRPPLRAPVDRIERPPRAGGRAGELDPFDARDGRARPRRGGAALLSRRSNAALARIGRRCRTGTSACGSSPTRTCAAPPGSAPSWISPAPR